MFYTFGHLKWDKIYHYSYNHHNHFRVVHVVDSISVEVIDKK